MIHAQVSFELIFLVTCNLKQFLGVIDYFKTNFINVAAPTAMGIVSSVWNSELKPIMNEIDETKKKLKSKWDSEMIIMLNMLEKSSMLGGDMFGGWFNSIGNFLSGSEDKDEL